MTDGADRNREAAEAPPSDDSAPGEDAWTNDDADHWVYVLRCADGTLYTGYTTDVERRVAEHEDGEGAKYTRGRTPVELVHVEGYSSRSTALSREHEIKTFSRRRKLRLIG